MTVQGGTWQTVTIATIPRTQPTSLKGSPWKLHSQLKLLEPTMVVSLKSTLSLPARD
ncbi:MAG: hypothetical protein US53_C0007G0001 [Candidatus Woesebacteria bacterium GW2011_GWA1_37_7]|uniref:Uncharacterized protein n=1 Tax=Candidatus Woesebacteria bacterium GW2011_GWA1_37_7 TaxID=1618545 RepID=A0A0G0H6T7_9BACT|nr:MAG: hypothetical protein US53_C0007G0001 [Candidatus Woesebacteria bacterium GW2011_GWA1_37_7]